MSLFAKVDQAGEVVKFPAYEQDIRKEFPNTSFPANMKSAPYGYAVVQDTPVPVYDGKTQKIEDGGVARDGKLYVRVWNIVPLGAEELLSMAKAERSEAVRNIQVTTASGKVFDGDEEAQGRMARAIVAMNDGESNLWVLANNVPAMVSKEEFKEALRLAGAAMTAVWVRPYQ